MKETRIILTKYIALTKAIFYKGRILNFFIIMLSYLTRRVDLKGAPFLIQVEPTNRCNLGCSLCLTGTGNLRRRKGDLGFEKFKIIIDQLERSIIYLALYNLGEPLLNPEIYSMIEYARGKRIFTRLSTNGVFHDKENIRKLISCGVNELIISLDCADPQVYFEYKRSHTFERVIENIAAMVKERGERPLPFINLQLLLMRDTEKEISRFKKMARRLKVDRGLIKKVRVDFPGVKPDRSFLPKDNKHIRNVYKNHSHKGLCIRPWISTLILWDGVVAPCCFDMDAQNTFGNAFSATFSEIWNNERYRSFRRQLLGGADKIPLCKQCSFRQFFKNFI